MTASSPDTIRQVAAQVSALGGDVLVGGKPHLPFGALVVVADLARHLLDYAALLDRWTALAAFVERERLAARRSSSIFAYETVQAEMTRLTDAGTTPP